MSERVMGDDHVDPVLVAIAEHPAEATGGVAGHATSLPTPPRDGVEPEDSDVVSYNLGFEIPVDPVLTTRPNAGFSQR